MLKIDFDPPEKQLAQFGLISLFGFPAVAGFMMLISGASVTLLWILLAVGITVFGLSLINTRLVKPIYIGLMLIALPIGMVISFALMVLIYYLLFTPVGLLFRALGKDPLAKAPDPSLDSYWIIRDKPRDGASYLRLY